MKKIFSSNLAVSSQILNCFLWNRNIVIACGFLSPVVKIFIEDLHNICRGSCIFTESLLTYACTDKIEKTWVNNPNFTIIISIKIKEKSNLSDTFFLFSRSKIRVGSDLTGKMERNVAYVTCKHISNDTYFWVTSRFSRSRILKITLGAEIIKLTKCVFL